MPYYTRHDQYVSRRVEILVDCWLVFADDAETARTAIALERVWWTYRPPLVANGAVFGPFDTVAEAEETEAKRLCIGE